MMIIARFLNLKICGNKPQNIDYVKFKKCPLLPKFFKKWKSYTQPFGYRLVRKTYNLKNVFYLLKLCILKQINIDFKTLYPDCPDLKCALEMKFQKVIKLLNEQTKDSANKKLLQNLNENITTISESNGLNKFF